MYVPHEPFQRLKNKTMRKPALNKKMLFILKAILSSAPKKGNLNNMLS